MFSLTKNAQFAELKMRNFFQGYVRTGNDNIFHGLWPTEGYVWFQTWRKEYLFANVIWSHC